MARERLDNKSSKSSHLLASKRRRRDGAAESSTNESTSSRHSSSKSAKNRGKHKKKSSRHDTDHAEDDSGVDSLASSTSMSSISSSGSSTGSKKSKQCKFKPASESAAFFHAQRVSSAFELQYPIFTVSIPPIHCSNPVAAVAELLDSLIMRFVPPLNGVLVSHGQIYFLTEGHDQSVSAIVEADSAFAKAQVAVECCVWRPRIGLKMQGTVTLSTPSHVSLLVHSTFNASISKSHLKENYEYVEGDASDGASGSSVGAKADRGGYWRQKRSRQQLGTATGGRVDFIVVSLTVSGHSLSIGGSLMPRPFSVAPPRANAFSSLQEQMGSAAQRAAKFGFTDASSGKRERRVRWEGEESGSESASDEDHHNVHERTNIKSAGKHVKF